MPVGTALVFRPTNAVRYQLLHFRMDDPVIVVCTSVLSLNDKMSVYPVVVVDIIPNYRNSEL
jgi:hypothetical protein